MNLLPEVVISLTGATLIALSCFILADALAERRAVVRSDRSPRRSRVRTAAIRLAPRTAHRDAEPDLLEHSKAA